MPPTPPIEFLSKSKNSKEFLFEFGTSGEQKLFVVIITPRLQTFPDPVGHVGASCWPLWIFMKVLGEGSMALQAVSELPLQRKAGCIGDFSVKN